ncbi:MAG: gliding motility protein GldN [Bacteroidetes bacterium]|nr:gliding motility protein GldN [Bacteroidota bacterium]
MKKLVFFILVPGLLLGIALIAGAQPTDKTPRDGVYDKTAVVQMEPIPYAPLREADIVWSKRLWRMVDMREKINQPFYFPETPQNGWKSLTQIIWDAMREGTITAYTVANDQFLTPVTYTEIKAKLQRIKKAVISRPDNPEEKFDTTYPVEFAPGDVKKLEIKEDWFFDRQRSVMESRILGICLMGASYDEQGIYRGDKPLFWVYFPECRSVFAKNEQFNLHNGSAARLSYDDVFMKRMFSSYIFKEENVYDRAIADYAVGVDALMESDKAKNSLLEFEETLWEY